MSRTIVSYIRENAINNPSGLAYRFLDDVDLSPKDLTNRELFNRVDEIAGYLSQRCNPGDRVLLLYPPGIDYIVAFYGCLMAGVIAVPLYPPRKNKKSDRIFKVTESCRAEIALTVNSEIDVIKGCWDAENKQNYSLEFVATDLLNVGHRLDDGFEPELDMVAFLQYTSGSTGVPKGVMITHQNIISNCEHLITTSTSHSKDVFVNWLPQFHDLGLVTAILLPIYLDATSVLMAPATFIREPVNWFKAISKYKGTLCGAPNFAFDLCISKISEEKLVGIDLSSWRVAYNAAEPVRAETLKHFTARFNQYGFKPETFYPGYGMAEATVLISGGCVDELPKILSVSKQQLAQHKVALCDETSDDSTYIIGCGRSPEPHEFRVVDPESLIEKCEGEVGEVWFRGPSVSPGYWQMDELNRSVFNQPLNGEAGYLRTGDLGTIVDGELYITGRIKDLIILNGKNYYPQDIELSTEKSEPAIRRGQVAAFSVSEKGVESLVVVAELKREAFRKVNVESVVANIRQAVRSDHGVQVDRVVLLKPYAIPMTSSGKIQRRQTKQMLLNNEFSPVGQSTNEQNRAIIAPETETEQQLLKIWKECMNLELISTQDNFFDIGGDSVTAIQISAKIESLYADTSLDMEVLLNFPTIKEMSRYIDVRRKHRELASKPEEKKRRITL